MVTTVFTDYELKLVYHVR